MASERSNSARARSNLPWSASTLPSSRWLRAESGASAIIVEKKAMRSRHTTFRDHVRAA